VPALPTPERAASVENSIWIAPTATTFSCLCEPCLELARGEGISFLAAVKTASVRGRLAPDTDVGFVSCAAGHELVVRRVELPPALTHPDGRQLQLT
jgi:hypothetical protein